MHRKVKAIVLTGNGTNCEMEMAHACKLAGADVVDIVHLSELLYGKKHLDDYSFLNLPGGFLDGDVASVASMLLLVDLQDGLGPEILSCSDRRVIGADSCSGLPMKKRHLIR